MLLSTCSATQMCCVPEASCTFATLSSHVHAVNTTAPITTLPSAATILTPATSLSYQAIITLSSFCIFFVVLSPFFIRHVPAALVFLHVALFPPAVSSSTSDLSASACLPCPASVPLYATLPHPKFYLPRYSDLHSVVPHEAIRCL